MRQLRIVVILCVLAVGCKKKPQPVPAPAPTPVPVVAVPQAEPKKPEPPKRQRPVVVPPPPPAPLPQLGEILTPERRSQLQASLAASQKRAQAILDQSAKLTLSTEQKNTVARIRTFLTQATEAQAKDLTTAVQLARRADLLAAELAKTLR